MFLLQLPCTSSCAVVSCVGKLVRHVLLVVPAAATQVARQVDVLDARLKALEALLANASPAK
jgi:hypothetical protein